VTSYGSERLADYIIILRGAVTASTMHDRGLSVSSARGGDDDHDKFPFAAFIGTNLTCVAQPIFESQ
jgi:hypothetical protein